MPDETLTTPPDDRDDLEALLRRCVEKYGAERDAEVAALCAAYPDRADEIRDRISMIDRLQSGGPSRPERIGSATHDPYRSARRHLRHDGVRGQEDRERDCERADQGAALGWWPGCRVDGFQNRTANVM